MANSKKLDEDRNQVSEPAGGSAALFPAAGRDAPVSASLLPSFAAACALVQAPYSCLVLESHRRHVVLPPAFIKRKKTGIQEELNSELLKYSSSLIGVPLAYDHIKIVGQYGDIFDDQGFIHLNIEASFVVFKPKKGDKLVGVINKMAVGHVGCLVHGCFNACVMKPHLLTPEQWRDSGFKVGDHLEFEVFQLDADVAGVLLIRGRLEKYRVNELVAAVSSTEMEEQRTTEEAAAEPESAPKDEGTEDMDSSKPKKKKKKKKNKELDSETMEDNGNQVAEMETLDFNSNGIKVKPDSDGPSQEKEKEKKKKKKKDKRHEADEEMPLNTELLNSDSSGYLSDKSKRKRKAQESEGLHEDSSMPSVKKKKIK
ncbi:DNA-directed RNA polymerase I subunit RPA43 [Astyanax mexicanus]|uniref:DNA-directed RNA polymerase I subunit RPA43 n=1 Tax=Astyanax mexicanus TaxID=7994 RepID=UPI0020CB4D62|nr:DNA-directed RNA polymerase I subunit RPA43 [Astyanax mexicanus]